MTLVTPTLRIVLIDKTRLVNIPPPLRFVRFDCIDWNRAFSKTYYERSVHSLDNFNRYWAIHISLFWFYTAYVPRPYTS
ncbi:hypothetical protein F5888DRAFT_1747741 [Russula emetica]|nr:hypothetical protein F5888DRAFT_1747741 [Russula emetica]